MCLGAVKWPPRGNLTRHELSRPTACLLWPPDTWVLCWGPSVRVINPNPISHFTCLFSTPPSLSDNKVLLVENHVCHHSASENLKPLWEAFEVMLRGSEAGVGHIPRQQTFLTSLSCWPSTVWTPPPPTHPPTHRHTNWTYLQLLCFSHFDGKCLCWNITVEWGSSYTSSIDGFPKKIIIFFC